MSLLRQQSNLELRVNPYDRPPSREEFLGESKDCDGVLVLTTERVDEEFLKNARKLKVVSSYSVGVDHIDVDACTRRGIVVTSTPNVLTDATADLAFALILAASRRVSEADRYVREKKWNSPFSPYLLVGKDLAHATIGIVGFGRIGQAVARRASGFGMKIVYYSHRRVPDLEELLGASFLPLEELLKISDIITIHAPLTPETRGMIGSREFSLMKKSTVFVNTSRGGLVEQTALEEALRSGTIFAAGLDVYEKEPLPTDSPLLNLDNIVLVPHIGSASTGARAGMAELSAMNLIDALNGKVPIALVNKQILHGVKK
jgi:lactate dehydrogenase-like 2-hydroxyacid dehydrogenase